MNTPELTPAARISLISLMLAGGEADPGLLVPKMTPATIKLLVKAGLVRDASTPRVPAVRAVAAVEASPAVAAVKGVRYSPAVPAKNGRPARPEVQAVAAVRARPAIEARPAQPARAAVPARKRVVAQPSANSSFVDLIGQPLVGKTPKKEDAVALAALVAKLQAVVASVGVGFEDILGQVPVPDLTEEMVDAAYSKVRRGSGIARLSALRGELSGFERSALDAILVASHEACRLQLMREDDQRSLTDEDRAAALVYKGERMYIVMRIS